MGSKSQTTNSLIIGLWEPYLDSSLSFVKKYNNLKEIKNNKDDDGNKIADDINGAFFTNEGFMVGLPNGVNDNIDLEDKAHGYVVAKLLLKGLQNIRVCHVGFMPTTMRLTKTGVLDLSVAERLKHFQAEIDYNDQFIKQTVGYFKDKKIKIVNCSFGTSASIFLDNNRNIGNSEQESKQNAFRWMKAFRQSYFNAFKNAPEILFIVSAGNDGELMDSVIDVPASVGLSNVVCVGALNKSGKVADFSNFGKEIDVYAPGENIELTMPDGKNKFLDGTSLATPIVTNIAIKILQKNKNLSGEKLKQALLNELKKENYKKEFLIPSKN